jgi:LacI family transcriptional regulator
MAAVKVCEVAKKLSLSPGTVSKALRGQSGQVSIVTAERVLEYCRSRGFISKAEMVGIMTKMHGNASKEQIFVMTWRTGIGVYESASQGFCEELQSHDLYPSFYFAHDESSIQRFAVDRAGVVIILGRMPDRLMKNLSARGVRLVLVDNHLPELDACSVNSSNLDSARQAVGILADLGHKRIAFFCLHEDEPCYIYTFHHRQLGYMAGMVEAGLPYNDLLVVGEANDYQDAKFEESRSIDMIGKHARKLLAMKPLPTAVVAVNDLHAYVLREILTDVGIKVPQDISIIGYDGQHRMGSPNQNHFEPVSTMVVNWQQMGREAAILALERLNKMTNGNGIKYLQLPAKYEDAGTVAPPRNE